MATTQRAPEEVTLRGLAANAKGGAVLVVDGAPIYLERMDEWPPGMAGTEVTVAGRLVQKKVIPDPVVGPDGAISQGAEGTQQVLEQVRIVGR